MIFRCVAMNFLRGATVAALAGGVAAAQSVFPESGDVARVLQAEGYAAKIEVDDQGDPVIRSSSQGVNWSVYFYGCEQGRNCSSVQFSAGFNLNEGISLERLNEWSRSKRYLYTYANDDMDPLVKMDVNMEGGVSETSFKASLSIWNSLLGQYLKHIGWN